MGWWGEGARKRPHLLCELVLTTKWLPLGAFFVFCFYPCFLGSLFRCRSTLQSSFVTTPPPGAALPPTMSLPSTYKGLQTLSCMRKTSLTCLFHLLCCARVCLCFLRFCAPTTSSLRLGSILIWPRNHRPNPKALRRLCLLSPRGGSRGQQQHHRRASREPEKVGRYDDGGGGG